jgi:RNA polymerase sigma-70 factor (ECF subfamily)
MKADARSVRQLLVARARERKAVKRGTGPKRIAREDVGAGAKGIVDILVLDEALTRLAALDAEQARIVELRYFGALSIQQAAAALGTSSDNVARQWTMARAWLKRAMDSAADDSSVLEL